MLITDPWFYLVAIPAVLLSGLGKGGMGSAMGVASVPLMSLVISPIQAAAITLPLLISMDAFAIWGYRKTFDRRILSIIILPGLLGVALGGSLVSYMREDTLRIMVGLISVLFSIQYMVTHFIPINYKPGNLAGRFWATMAGFTSFSIHAGGAPISVYLLPQKLDKKQLAGTQAVFFGTINFAKIFAYASLGEFDVPGLSASLVLFPLAPFGVWLGMKWVQKINEILFYRTLYAGLLITGIKLLWDGMLG